MVQKASNVEICTVYSASPTGLRHQRHVPLWSAHVTASRRISANLAKVIIRSQGKLIGTCSSVKSQSAPVFRGVKRPASIREGPHHSCHTLHSLQLDAPHQYAGRRHARRAKHVQKVTILRIRCEPWRLRRGSQPGLARAGGAVASVTM